MKVVRAQSVTFNPTGACLECEYTWPARSTTRDEAKSHVSSTGHEVRLVAETVDIYRPAQA